MKKKGGLFIIIGTLLFICILWISLYFIPNSSAGNEISNYIPEDATTIIEFNNKVLTSELAEDLLENSEAESILKQLLEQRKDESREEYGIDLTRSVYYFANANTQGLLIPLSNPEKWDNASINKQFLKSRKDNVGILQFEGKAPIQLSKRATTKKIEHSDAIIAFQFEALKGTFSIEESELILRGESSLKARLINTLKPEGFHLSSSVIPSILNDSVANWTDGAIQSITGLSMNYYGTAIEQNEKINVFPTCEVILESNDPIQLSKLVESNLFFKQYNWRRIDSLTYDSKDYTLKLITPTTLFFDKKANENSIIQKCIVMEISGQPQNLTHLSGNRTIAGLVSLFPAYAIPNGILQEIESSDVAIKNGKLNGSIQFKDGQQPLLVILEKILNQ